MKLTMLSRFFSAISVFATLRAIKHHPGRHCVSKIGKAMRQAGWYKQEITRAK
jgi:hypothetical protein